MGETELAALLCAFLAGSDAEPRHYFDANGMKRYIRVDCETPSHVIEIGLDSTDSARDSLHQALFAAHLTGKIPMVVLIDQDGYEGRFEFEMRHVTRVSQVQYARCSKEFILRWSQTASYRQIGNVKALDDLPVEAVVRSRCDLQSGLTVARAD